MMASSDSSRHAASFEPWRTRRVEGLRSNVDFLWQSLGKTRGTINMATSRPQLQSVCDALLPHTHISPYIYDMVQLQITRRPPQTDETSCRWCRSAVPFVSAIPVCTPFSARFFSYILVPVLLYICTGLGGQSAS